MSAPRTRTGWGPDIAIGIAFGVLTLGEAFRRATLDNGPSGYVWSDFFDTLLIGGLVAVGAGLHRRSPGTALVLAAAAGTYQLVFGVSFVVAELGIAVIAYGCGRWGSPVLLWISGLAIPIGAVGGYLYFQANGVRYIGMLRSLWSAGFWRNFADSTQLSRFLLLTILSGLVLLVPWLLGIALRFRQRADVTEVARQEALHDAEQAQQIAELKEQQADLARDVHDVVGHSLAVILAQAEAAQFRDDTDHESLKQSMRDIADAARGSLRDVRNVLNRADDSAPQMIGSLDSLIDGVRVSGQEIVTRVTGTPRPLPPELDVVSYRVLQEMLTNAIKHGLRDAPVNVTRDWSDGLRIEVANESSTAEGAAGQGLNGLRRRVDAVGGTVTVQHESNRFVVTARIPLRPA
ncbi:MAG TPA: histidine kinase [Marmoricola sp.]|nr:histidine kinase [Marmoricola sp.]